jgi:hypothetical protein
VRLTAWAGPREDGHDLTEGGGAPCGGVLRAWHLVRDGREGIGIAFILPAATRVAAIDCAARRQLDGTERGAADPA